MNYLTSGKDKNLCYKGMTKGDKYYKCGLYAYNLGWGADYELVGYAMVNDFETAKKLFFKELEDDEEATIGFYMVITPYEYVGSFKNEKGQIKHARKCGPTMLNNFGHWETKRKWFKDRYGVDLGQGA